MERCIPLFVVLLSFMVSLVPVRDDFTLEIGDGYTLIRASSVDVGVGKKDGCLLLSPFEYDKVGPVVRFAGTRDHIFTWHHGRKPRNLFDGDSVKEVDPSREYYFIISKLYDVVQGPFSGSEFNARPEVAGLGSVDWRTPKTQDVRNPLVGRPLWIALFTILVVGLHFYDHHSIRRRSVLSGLPCPQTAPAGGERDMDESKGVG